MKVTLEPFAVSQKMLEGQNYVSVSLLLMAVGAIDSKLSTIINDLEKPDSVQSACKKMQDDFRSRWRWSEEHKFSRDVMRGHMNRQYGMHPSVFYATLLDPRMKGLAGISQQDRDNIKDVIIEKMVAMADVNSDSDSDSDGDVAVTVGNGGTPDNANDPLWVMYTQYHQGGQGMGYRQGNGGNVRQQCEEEFNWYI